MFIEILFKILLFKGGELIYAEHCIFTYIYIYICVCVCALIAHTLMSNNELLAHRNLSTLPRDFYCNIVSILNR